MGLDDRKAKILSLVIEAYIETGEPIGSKALAEQLEDRVSSATIRNDMAALTAMGYLEQPHTSAGRLPTAKAFRLYIDKLMHRRPLDERERREIDERLNAAAGDPQQLLESASRALADATGLAAAVAADPGRADGTLRRIDIMQMSARNMAVVIVPDNDVMRSRMCHCRQDIPNAVTMGLSNFLSRRFLGCPLSAITLDSVQEVLTQLGGGGAALLPILSTFYGLVREAAASQVLLSGQMNLLRHPDYALENARPLMDLLDERQKLGDVMQSQQGGLQLILGSDELPELSGSSMIVTHYSLGHRGKGTIGIIGPVRMNYADAVPRIEYFAGAIGKLLAELFDDEA